MTIDRWFGKSMESRPLHELLFLLALYGTTFALLHQAAAIWATSYTYSLWSPAAGLRLAALWRFGPSSVVLLAPLEAAALAFTAFLQIDAQPDILVLGSTISSSIGYALAVGLAKRSLWRSHLGPSVNTLQLGLATVLAPLFGFIANVPWHAAGNGSMLEDGATFFRHALVYYLGDLTGILLFAPPLLWVAQIASARKTPTFGRWRDWALVTIVLCSGGLVVWTIQSVGLGVRLVPLLIAVAVVGLLYGRLTASISILIVSVIVLFELTTGLAEARQIPLQLQLAATAMVGYLAGSYSDDQKRNRQQLQARDRMLLQSERLKSLRAMSVAVIHELSQPLSTLSLETNYLARLSQSPGKNEDEIREVAALIARKTESLSSMVRRLRSFGGSAGEQPSIVYVEDLVRNVIELIAAEAKGADVRIEMRIQEDLAVEGQDIELQQAVTNLLRNAITATPGGTVQLFAASAPDDMVSIKIVNTPTQGTLYRRGMGVGKLIVEAVAVMHGGSLMEEIGDDGEWHMTLQLPRGQSFS